jgi:hypothetical protein
MRLWLKDSERRPDPIPAATDDRKAVIVGVGAWAIALVVVLVTSAASAGESTVVWTCISGLALGAILLGYTIRRAR